jgi:hypothetical protein
MSLLNIFKARKPKRKNYPKPNTVPKNVSKNISDKLKDDVLRAGLYDSDVQAFKTYLEAILSELKSLTRKEDSESIQIIANKVGAVYQELLNTSASGETLVKLIGEDEKQETQTSVFHELSQIGTKVHDSGRTILKTLGTKIDQIDAKIERAISGLKSQHIGIEEKGKAGLHPGDGEKMDKVLLALRALSEKQDNGYNLLRDLVSGSNKISSPEFGGEAAVERAADIWLWHREKDSARRKAKVVLIIPSLEGLTEKTVQSFLEINTLLVSEIQAPAVCSFLGIAMPPAEEDQEDVTSRRPGAGRKTNPSGDDFPEKDSAPGGASNQKVRVKDNTESAGSEDSADMTKGSAGPLFGDQDGEPKTTVSQDNRTNQNSSAAEVNPEKTTIEPVDETSSDNHPADKSNQTGGEKQNDGNEAPVPSETAVPKSSKPIDKKPDTNTKSGRKQNGGSGSGSPVDQTKTSSRKTEPDKSIITSKNANAAAGKNKPQSDSRVKEAEPPRSSEAVKKIMENINPEEASGYGFLTEGVDFSGTEQFMTTNSDGPVRIVSKE